MKTLRYMFPVLLLLSALLVSCVAEPVSFSNRENEQEVRITINTGTRAEEGPGTPAGDLADRYINSLRILGYRISDGSLAFNKYDKFVGTADENMDSREWDVEVLTGRFNIVFIANEHSDAVTSGLLAEIDETTNHSRGYLQENVTFSYEAFSALKDIPMVTLKEDVHIKANYQLEDPDQTVNGGSWSVLMERLGVRIDMALTLEEGQEVEEDAKLTITKIPKKIHLFKGQYNDSDEETDYTSEEYPYIVPTTIDADGKEVLSWKRIILPESMFEETTNKGKGVALAVEVNGDKCETVIGIDAFNDTEQDRDYTLPRNTYLDIAATANPSAKELECEATVKPWDVVSQKVIIDGQFFLKVNEDEFLLTEYMNTRSIIAETNYEVDDRGFPAGVKVEKETGCNWLTTSVNKNGDENYTISISSTANTGSTLRTAKVYVKAGNMTKVINVTQIPPPVLVHREKSYVGAFWKANQTGERLIKIETEASTYVTNYNDAKGDWKVFVLDYGDFNEGEIVFSPDMSTDPGIYGTTPADMNNSANDASYYVDGDNTSLSGSVANDGDEIFFRIGLKSKWTPTSEKPVRYALLILSYNDNTKYQKIWLRQGEDADYLMYPGDKDENGSEAYSGRNYAKKWSPYNLTSVGSLEEPLYYYQMPIARKGIFVDYPSQVGAFFQGINYTSGFERRAYHPTTTISFNANWNNYLSTTFTWETGQETCPQNYRRPQTPTPPTPPLVMDKCELLNSHRSKDDRSQYSKNNSVWGYYADGFFDRRTPGIASGTDASSSKTVVDNGTRNAAYIGTLIFNPVYDSPRKNASMFFPAGGYRIYNNGKLSHAGKLSQYWTNSLYGIGGSPIPQVIHMFSFSSNYDSGHGVRLEPQSSFGHLIRCVVEDPQ